MASVFSDDMEGADFTNWTSTLVEAGNTLAKNATAVKNGSQGLQCINGTTNDDCRANKTITGAAELWTAFWFRIVTSPTTSNHDLLFKFATSATAVTARFGIRTQATFTNRLHTGDLTGWTVSSPAFDFTEDTWYGIRFHAKIESVDTANDGLIDVETSTDGTNWTSRVARTNGNTGVTNFSDVQIGHDAVIPPTGVEFWYDDLDVDDAAYPVLNTGAAGWGRLTNTARNRLVYAYRRTPRGLYFPELRNPLYV